MLGNVPLAAEIEREVGSGLVGVEGRLKLLKGLETTETGGVTTGEGGSVLCVEVMWMSDGDERLGVAVA